MNLLDIVGTKINHLIVLSYAGKKPPKKKYHAYFCECDCGKKVSILRIKLISKTNKQQSCGCKKIETFRTFALNNKKHGMSKKPEYNLWSTMRSRCTNPNNAKWKAYGGRGISICDRWKNFQIFYLDMGKKPGPGFSIDRIDVNGNYCPENCRWATQKTQQNNRRNNTWITFNGECKTIKEWQKITGINSQVIRQRIFRDKKTIEQALTTTTDRWGKNR